MDRFFSFTPTEYFFLGCAAGWILGTVIVAIVTRFQQTVQVMWMTEDKLLKLARTVKRELEYRFPERYARHSMPPPRYDDHD